MAFECLLDSVRMGPEGSLGSVGGSHDSGPESSLCSVRMGPEGSLASVWCEGSSGSARTELEGSLCSEEEVKMGFGGMCL